MSGILVLAEHDGGRFQATASELLGRASELASELGMSVSAAVLGDAPASELGAFGASTVYQAQGDFSTYDTGAIADALSAILRAAQPDVLLAPASYGGRDAIPRVTARFGTAQATECTALSVVDGQVVGRRPMYAGRAYADVQIASKPAVFTVRPNSFGQPTPGAGTATVEAVSWEATTPTLTLVEELAPDSSGIDLGSAERVVSGGRSLKSAEQFDSVIRPLGVALGAGVGATRAATDAGYAPHAEQVGQTGQTVNPNLYIACGISGAIQHLAGMRTSNVIVAINKDPDAPIFEHATYGIVNDLFDVVPELTRLLQDG